MFRYAFPLAIASLIAVSLTALAVGGRLLALAQRTRELPELLLGCAVLLNGLGFLAFSLAVQTDCVPASARIATLTAGSLGIAAGAGCVTVFTWWVFRPYGLAPLLLTGSIILMLGAGFVNLLVIPEPAWMRTASPLYRVGLAGRTLAYGWAAFESFRYYRMLLRRTRLGLAQASAATRMRLWSLAAGASFVNFLIVAGSLVLGSGQTHSKGLIAVYSAVGMLSAAALWPAFFPLRLRWHKQSRLAS